ncbi:MAG: hypothetical protein K4445_10905 [Deltaproteobacteria bacterium]|nr:hypothetical protein [Syntrophaceae bacterium]
MFIVVYANSEEKRHQKKAEFAIRLTPEMQCVAHPQEIILLFIISAGHPAARSAGIRMRRCARNAAFFSLFCAPKKFAGIAAGMPPVHGRFLGKLIERGKRLAVVTIRVAEFCNASFHSR